MSILIRSGATASVSCSSDGRCAASISMPCKRKPRTAELVHATFSQSSCDGAWLSAFHDTGSASLFKNTGRFGIIAQSARQGVVTAPATESFSSSPTIMPQQDDENRNFRISSYQQYQALASQ